MCSLSEAIQTSYMINALRLQLTHTFWKFHITTTSPLSVTTVLPDITTLTYKLK